MLTKFFLIVIAVLLLGIIGLLTSLFIQYKMFSSKIKKIEEESKAKFTNYAKKAQEILNDAKDKKDSIHTGNNADDFNASINILHKPDKERK